MKFYLLLLSAFCFQNVQAIENDYLLNQPVSQFSVDFQKNLSLMKEELKLIDQNFEQFEILQQEEGKNKTIEYSYSLMSLVAFISKEVIDDSEKEIILRAFLENFYCEENDYRKYLTKSGAKLFDGLKDFLEKNVKVAYPKAWYAKNVTSSFFERGQKANKEHSSRLFTNVLSYLLNFDFTFDFSNFSLSQPVLNNLDVIFDLLDFDHGSVFKHELGDYQRIIYNSFFKKYIELSNVD